MSDKPYNAGDEEDVKKAKKKRRASRDAFKVALADILQTEAGRHVVAQFLHYCHPMAEVPTMDHGVMCRLEGHRDVGFMIKADIDLVDVNAYNLIEYEKNNNKYGELHDGG